MKGHEKKFTKPISENILKLFYRNSFILRDVDYKGILTYKKKSNLRIMQRKDEDGYPDGIRKKLL